MGKRSTNTTKSGKFMNPTDQARKEARKRELKKNKKQRQLVRTAVLKGKNPTDIIVELEKIDDMEYNVLAPPPLNEKVLRDKRRKLVETWNRVMHLYERENVEQFVDLKKLWHNYLGRKKEVMAHFDAVKNAQNVSIDDIPLPDLPGSNKSSDAADAAADATDIPLPPKAGILKKKSSVLDSLRPKSCPGVPAGPPPPLQDYLDINLEAVEAAVELRSKRIRFEENDNNNDAEEEEEVVAPGEEKGPKVDDLQKKMLAMAGQDVDAYMKEMEEVHKATQAEKALDLRSRMARLEKNQPGPPGVAEILPPQPLMMRPNAPPLLRQGVPPPPPGVRLPPGPPPGRPPVPPGPPPGRPPMMPNPPPNMHNIHNRLPHRMRPPHMPRPPLGGGVVSAGPQLNASGSIVKTGSVIEAKPQMRNLLSDVTRFVPTNVKVKREAILANNASRKKQTDPMRDVFAKHSQPQAPQQSKDDAYAQFMAEMEQMK